MPLRPALLSLVLGSALLLGLSVVLFALGIGGVWSVAIAGCLVIGAEAALLKFFLDGLPELRGAAIALARKPGETPPFTSPSPTIDAIWRAILTITTGERRRRRWLEQELQSVTQILAALPDPLLLVNGRREVIDINAAGREMFGENLLNRDLAAALRHPGVLDAADTVLRGGPGTMVEVELSSPVERHFNARIVPLPRITVEDIDGADEAEGEPISAIKNDIAPVALIVLHDLTAIKRTEQMRVDFVANASHELRTPLSTLLGFIETLQGPAADDTDAQKRFLAIMHEQAARMTRLVEDLLSLSRIEMNEHMLPTGRANPVTVLNSVARSLQLKAASRQMTIDLSIQPDCPDVVGDTDELLQVFQNLIDNALKYGHPRTPVTITVSASARLRPGIAIAVADQGDGIPRIHLPRLTERFYRVDTARSRRMGGTGLGLAIVKHIVNRHRGILEIDSEIGRGSVFTIHLKTVGDMAAVVLAPAGGEMPRRMIPESF